LDEPKPRAALFEGLLDADGDGTDPVEEEVVLVPVALALKASKVFSGVGLTAKTMPA